jgi:predicted dehydrogenase
MMSAYTKFPLLQQARARYGAGPILTENPMHALLIGAGQLGSRHLQGLAASPQLRRISVIEPSAEARETAAARFAQIEESTGKQLIFTNGETLRAERIAIDYAVLATGSLPRLTTLHEALSLGAKHLLCEKILFPSIAQYREALALVKSAGATVYVSHVMRYVPLYQHLRARIAAEKAQHIVFEVTAGDAGMGCNLIHYLDCFTFLTGRAVTAITCTLDRPLLKSKRGGAYIEFTGSASAHTGEGDMFRLSFRAGDAALPVLRITWEGVEYRISEGDDAWKCTNSGEQEALQFPIMSQLSGRILHDILNHTCPLPQLADSFETNRLMLNAINAQLQDTFDEHTFCHIT